MLTGQFGILVDEKGRILIPSKLRQEIPDNMLIITAGVDTCLWIYLPEQWRKISQQLMGKSSFSYKTRLIQRRIVAPAQEVELDRTGRVLIPQHLQHIAKLKKECILHGLQFYMELWDAQQYQTYLSQHEEDFLEAAEELGGSIFLE